MRADRQRRTTARRAIGVLGALAGALLPAATAAAAPSLPPLPPRWPAVLHLGMAQGPGGAASLRASAPFGFRYQYLGGGVNTAAGWAVVSPMLVTDIVQESIDHGLVPVFPYYQMVQSAPGAGQSEADANATNLQTASTMAAYYADLRLFFQHAAAFPARLVVLHLEPDLWGYVQQGWGDDASAAPARVAASGDPELAGLPDTVAGFARAIVRLRDLHAPNVVLAYHLSVWGTLADFASSNAPPEVVDTLAARSAAFYRSLGAVFDLVFSDYTDKDAAYKQYVDGDGGASWWDAADFERHVRYLGGFVGLAGKRVVLWQIPLGNTRMRAMDNTFGHYQDNRVEWLLAEDSRAHLDAYRRAGVVAFLFGRAVNGNTCACDASGDGVTDPAPINGNTGLSLSADDDGGFFRQKAREYYDAGPLPLESVEPPPGVVLHALTLSVVTARAGDTVRASVTVSNPGPAGFADAYLGVQLPAAAAPATGCPTGDAAVFLEAGFAGGQVHCLSGPPASFPAIAGSVRVDVIPTPITVVDFWSVVIPPGVPPGPYTVFLALTPPGAMDDGVSVGDVLTVATATFTVLP
jgi:hypothetical protein